jgi:hypothetical protein
VPTAYRLERLFAKLSSELDAGSVKTTKDDTLNYMKPPLFRVQGGS